MQTAVLSKSEIDQFHRNGVGAKIAALNCSGHAVEHDPRQEFRGGIPPLESRLVVEVTEVELAQDAFEHLGRQPDVDDDPVGVEVGALELDVHEKRRAVQLLRGAEYLAAEAVGDHHVVTNGHGVHKSALGSGCRL